MASASCAGKLPPYPHSKPVGLWLRSARRGLRGLRSPFPSMTQTTHPCGPRRRAYTFLLRARRSVVLVSAFIVFPFMGSKTPPAGRFATTGQGRRAPGLRLLRMVAFKPGGAAGARATDPCGGGSASGSASVHLSRPGSAMYWPLPAWRCSPRLLASVFGGRLVALSRNHGHSVPLFQQLSTLARGCAPLCELTHCQPWFRSPRQSDLGSCCLAFR